MKTVTISGNSYSMGDEMAKAVIQTAKDAMKGKNAIVLIEKKNVIQMKRDTFPSISDLEAEVRKYIKDGFKVSYVMGGGENGK